MNQASEFLKSRLFWFSKKFYTLDKTGDSICKCEEQIIDRYISFCGNTL